MTATAPAPPAVRAGCGSFKPPAKWSVLHQLPPHTVATLTSRTYLPGLVVFILAAVLAGVGAVVSLLRGGVSIHEES